MIRPKRNNLDYGALLDTYERANTACVQKTCKAKFAECIEAETRVGVSGIYTHWV